MEGKKMNNSQNKNLLTEGSIWKKLMGFAFPLFLGNLFQQLYNTADSLIVGNFLGSDAPVSNTHLRSHETLSDLVFRRML